MSTLKKLYRMKMISSTYLKILNVDYTMDNARIIIDINGNKHECEFVFYKDWRELKREIDNFLMMCFQNECNRNFIS